MIPSDMTEIEVESTRDGSREKSLLFLPPKPLAAPLLVGLHTWSCDRFNQIQEMLPRCRERGWGLLLPEFRGPNLTSNPRATEACASALAIQDVLDATEFALTRHGFDRARVFLLGGSGGGHMALMLAAAAPSLWRKVSAWVPITDLAAWHGENPNYAPHIAACCGGVPGSDAAVDAEYRERSPLTHVDRIAQATLSLHHGRYDPSVPYTHSWRMAEALERAGAKRFFFDIFDGGHDLLYDEAFRRFDRIVKQGAAAGRPLTG